jgi:hypothetical protein
MTLEFGLTLTGLGVLSMFSALVIIIVVCEILKRMFKEPETGNISLEIPGKKITLDRKMINIEEEAKITAAVMAYMNDTSNLSKRIITLKRGRQPLIWNIASRLEIVELRRGGKLIEGKKI